MKIGNATEKGDKIAKVQNYGKRIVHLVFKSH